MIDQNQNLLVKFPNLGSDDVIIPGTANLSFNTEFTSTADPNRTLVSNIGRAIIKKLALKFEGTTTGTCGKLSQKREMLSNKASSLMTVACPTA